MTQLSDQPAPSGGVVESSNQPDYSALEIPAKPPSEYSYAERRAALLQQIRSLGHPKMLHQGEAADRYGVSQQQISKDLDRIAEHVTENLGARRDLATQAVFDRCVRGLLEQEEYRKAAQTVKDYEDWLTQRRDLQELNAKLDRIEQRQERGSR